MSNHSIGIVGYGIVGRSVHSVFGDDACWLDVPAAGQDRRRINRCDVAFVCVPTPVGQDGCCDTSIVESCIAWIETPLIVIRSTVAPGTTERLRDRYGKRVLFQPEYLGETPDHPLADARRQGFVVLGGPLDECCALADIYKGYFHSNVRFHFTSSGCAELAKYMENAFLAVKVTFCNEFYEIARACGVQYNELREIWLADPRMGRDHTFVYPQDRGFGGKCLPKDLCAIIHASRLRRFEPALLAAVMGINESYRAGDPAYEPYRGLAAPAPAQAGPSQGCPVPATTFDRDRT